MKLREFKLFKIILFIIVIALISGIIVYMVPVLKDLNTEAGQIAFKDKVNNSGFFRIIVAIWNTICTNIFDFYTRRTN